MLRSLALAPRGALPDVVWRFEWADATMAPAVVTAARLRERLSEPYRARVDLVMDASVPRGEWLGRRAALSIERPGVGVRTVHGVVARVEEIASERERRRVRVDLVPALWLLGQRVDYRIFQDLDVPTIVAAVLREAGIYLGGQDHWRLRRTYAPRTYCVQYGESDLGFITRLLDEEGIGYGFDEGEAEERLVLMDEPSAARWIDRRTLRRTDTTGLSGDAEGFTHFAETERVRPTAVVLEDYDPMHPRAVDGMRPTYPQGDPGERVVRVHPGRFVEEGAEGAAVRAVGGQRVRRRYGAETVAARIARGEGTVTGLTPGAMFTVDDPTAPRGERAWVAVSVAHAGRSSTDGALGEGSHGNRVVAIPAESMAWPRRRTQRPKVRGPQTARVVSGTGEALDVDAQRRVLVQFRWDLREKVAEPTCRVRVAQALAGNGWGTVFIPREGMEVVVQFLDGDPDHPLITGCVYNGENPPPHDGPTEATRTTLRTASVPGGHAHHELTFDDAEERAEVYLHAAGNFRESVTGDKTVTVRGQETIDVGVARATTESPWDWEPAGTVRTVRVHGDSEHLVDGMETTLADAVHIEAPNGVAMAAGMTHPGEAARVCAFDLGTLGAAYMRLVVGHVQVEVRDGGIEVVVRDGEQSANVRVSVGDSRVSIDRDAIELSTGHGASIALRGGRVNIEGDEVCVRSRRMTEVTAEATLTLHGAPVLINC